MRTAIQARQEIMDKEVQVFENKIKNIINELIEKGGKTRVHILNSSRIKIVSKLSQLGYEVTESTPSGFYNIDVY